MEEPDETSPIQTQETEVPATPTSASGQATTTEAPQSPPASAPAISEHPYAAAMAQLRDIKGDAALLLHTGARLITDEISRLRAEGAIDRAEIVQLRERAHKAEIQWNVLKARADDASSQSRLRDANLAIGGVFAGVGFASWQQSGGFIGPAVFVAGFVLILATLLLPRTSGAAK